MTSTANGDRGVVLKHVGVGALFGALLLHPITMSIYWFEFNDSSDRVGDILLTILDRVILSFNPPMSPMMALFLLLGGALGFGSGLYYRELRRKDRQLKRQALEIEQNVLSLIDAGEGSRLEFKSSIRWDRKQQTLNKSLEHAVLKTLAGFMNGPGGTLLLGVDDGGTILGLESDYATLKHATRDGYQRHLTTLVASSTRTDFCDLVHIRFARIDDNDICIVNVEASDQPVYVRQGSQAKYFLRVGNATRELNTQEAVEHVNRRFRRGWVINRQPYAVSQSLLEPRH